VAILHICLATRALRKRKLRSISEHRPPRPSPPPSRRLFEIYGACGSRFFQIVIAFVTLFSSSLCPSLDCLPTYLDYPCVLGNVEWHSSCGTFSSNKFGIFVNVSEHAEPKPNLLFSECFTKSYQC
jgi:hypothetical protein